MSTDDFPTRMHKLANRMMGVKPRSDPRKAEGTVYATFQDRIFASAIDTGVILIVCQDLFRWIMRQVYADFKPNVSEATADVPLDAPIQDKIRPYIEELFVSGIAERWLINAFIQSIVVGIILVSVWYYFNQTPGKFILGIKHADKKTNEEPTLKQYIIRYLGFYLSMPFFMIGFALLGINKHKQAWHDRIAGTVVIYTKEGNILQRGYDWIKARIRGTKTPGDASGN